MPATAGSTRAAASCKVSEPVCDPSVGDGDALTLVRRRCAGCHAEGGKASHPLLELPALLEDRGNVALRLSGCEMPPDTTPLPTDERARLIGWGACTAASVRRDPAELPRIAAPAGDQGPDTPSW